MKDIGWQLAVRSWWSLFGRLDWHILGIFCIVSVSFGGCANTRQKSISPAFYHWKTNFNLSDFEQNQLDSLNIQKLYVKFFDVDWDFSRKDAVPQADINFVTIPKGVEIIPTIFITNRTFENVSEKDIPVLAHRIHQKIYDLGSQIPDLIISEIQFDCDWTLSTKSKFFEFIHQFNALISEKGAISSATIRLHQIKFFEKTGVPPVDRGILMFYNMGEIEDWETNNSILDLEIGQQYFQNFDAYPLDLDVALPIFQWGILFRDWQMILIINNLTEIDLSDQSRFKKIKKNRFQVIKSTYLNGQYLYKDDLIRLENINQKELEESAKMLSSLIQNNELILSFYHLDSLSISNFPPKNLKRILSKFE